MVNRDRHILGISGGKDSSALALYMRDREPRMEHFFCDTGSELPETYEWLDKMEGALGKKIERLGADKGFEHYLEQWKLMPTVQRRWCTRVLKIEPLQKWIGDDYAVTYVGIRADEPNRKGYTEVTGGHITQRFPFVEDGINLTGVKKILKDAGLGLPGYYDWRTRSGCYFCFFQRKSEWVGLARRHPKLFARAVEIEASTAKFTKDGKPFTWSQGETLPELMERESEIMERAAKRAWKEAEKEGQLTLEEAIRREIEGTGDPEEDALSAPCMSCHL